MAIINNKTKYALNLFVLISIGLVQSLYGQKLNIKEQFPDKYNLYYGAFQEYREQHGRGMTKADYIAYANRHDLDDDFLESKAAYQAFSDSQQPIISKGELQAVFDAKLQALDDFSSKYQFVKHDLSSGARVEEWVATSRQEGKCYAEVAIKDSSGGLLAQRRIGYNGKHWKTFVMKDEENVYGVIDEKQRFGDVLKAERIQRYCYLNSNPSKDQKDNYYSLEYLFDKGAIILEETVNVDGRECIVVSSGLHEIYLDPTMGFTVVKYINHRFRKNDQGDGYLDTVGEIVYSDFVDYGNGIYLPNSIASNVLKDGEIVGTKWHLAVQTLEINGTTTNVGELFDNMFQEGTLIIDKVAGISYTQGFPGQMQQTIDENLDKLVFVPEETADELITTDKLQTPMETEPVKSNNIIMNDHELVGSKTHQTSVDSFWLWALATIVAITIVVWIGKKKAKAKNY